MAQVTEGRWRTRSVCPAIEDSRTGTVNRESDSARPMTRLAEHSRRAVLHRRLHAIDGPPDYTRARFRRGLARRTGSLFAGDNDPERHNWDTALQCWAAFVGCVGALFPRARGRVGFAQGSSRSAAPACVVRRRIRIRLPCRPPCPDVSQLERIPPCRRRYPPGQLTHRRV